MVRRIASYFQGTELACAGLPHGREPEILDSFRGEVPTEVFITPYWNPVGGNPEAVRGNLLEAIRLLETAGYAVRDLRLVDVRTGEPFRVEFLLPAPTYERFVLFYQESLERLGIDVTVRVVDDVQYENRLRNWDFDIIVAAWAESLTPCNEQREYWGSHASNTPGSRNLVGISNKAIDALIDHMVFAANRDELVAATRALDRVLLWHHLVVPQWTYDKIPDAGGGTATAIGPVVPLDANAAEGGELLGAGRRPAPSMSDPIATRIMSRGAAIAASVGRADDLIENPSLHKAPLVNRPPAAVWEVRRGG